MNYFIGFVIALFIALTGVGAGTVTVPVLVLFLGVPAVEAVGIGRKNKQQVSLLRGSIEGSNPGQLANTRAQPQLVAPQSVLAAIPGGVLQHSQPHKFPHAERSGLHLGHIGHFAHGWGDHGDVDHFAPDSVRSEVAVLNVRRFFPN